MNANRFAAALRSYLSNHSQRDLANASRVERSVISRIVTGSRRAPIDAAHAINAAIPPPDCIPVLIAWLEDQIPDQHRGLIRIIAEATASPAPAPETDDARALAWIQHQIETNVHAVQAIVDLWRASGSPDTPAMHSPAATADNGLHGDDGDPHTGTFHALPDPAPIVIYTDKDLGPARAADHEP